MQQRREETNKIRWNIGEEIISLMQSVRKCIQCLLNEIFSDCYIDFELQNKHGYWRILHTLNHLMLLLFFFF